MTDDFDREKIVEHVRSGIGEPAQNGFVPVGINDYNGNSINGYKHDPDKVKEQLFEAGYTGENGRPSIKLTCANNYKVLCEYIMRDLNEQGFDVEVELLLPSMFRQQVANHTTNFFRKSWTCDYPDPINFLMLFHSGNFAPDRGPNYTHFKNEQFDIWFERAEQTKSDSERRELYRKMDQMIKDEAVVIPLFYDELVKFVSHKVSGLESNPMNQLDLKRVKIN